jgi:hypothetical protein
VLRLFQCQVLVLADASPVSTDSNTARAHHTENIVPQALSELDVQRLAWAVKRVRQIVNTMQAQGAVLWELSPGAKKPADLVPEHRESSEDQNGVGSEAEDGELLEWVSCWKCCGVVIWCAKSPVPLFYMVTARILLRHTCLALLNFACVADSCCGAWVLTIGAAERLLPV